VPVLSDHLAAVTAWWWSWLLTVVGVTGLWFAGRKDWRGWLIGLAAQALWITYALVSQQYGFLASAAAYGWVYGLNVWRWTRRDKTNTETVG